MYFLFFSLDLFYYLLDLRFESLLRENLKAAVPKVTGLPGPSIISHSRVVKKVVY